MNGGVVKQRNWGADEQRSKSEREQWKIDKKCLGEK